ncbi:Zn-dependent hydrolase [Nonomuraea mesophila]|uniref:Zn-dependent hydrolase n=1 Tax=Nonomuraea mesophila TaxID=2530382 RepID=A0A4R5E8Y9_9ACTN|nr:MBL fold metallo-hydrolase [Nonomuraea mesophila]TDE27883.1 Zn-dependent hydrolase [Nonomuraea mesophila]
MARKRTARRVLAGGAVLAAAGWALRDLPAELGVRPLTSGPDREARIRRSPQFRDGAFVNPAPETSLARPPASLLGDLAKDREQRRPGGIVPLRVPPSGPPPEDGVRAVWYGHASTLVEIEGRRVLFDPVWSRRVSPTRLVGPKRHHPVPVELGELPQVDAIAISHDHYDHLDLTTVRALTRMQKAPFLVPLGIGAHLERWGVPAFRIIELDWDEEAEVAGLRFVATAARHFSGRTFTRNDTLWGSWVVAGAARRVFYAGDSGYFEGYRGIGSAHGPFDLTLMPIGAYSPAWPDIHMTPEEAVNAHLDLGGGLLLPVHWATFTLALHPWAEPVERLWREAKARDVEIVVPRPGEAVDTTAAPVVDGWWETLA